MKYFILSSGSRGNSTLVCTKGGNFLIDCGITKKLLVSRLATCGKGIEDIDYLLVTHSHSDHISGIKFIPEEKWFASINVLKEELPKDHYLVPFRKMIFGETVVTTLTLSHDAPSVGFLFEDGEESLVYLTDTGYIPERTLRFIENKTYYIFESNHDTKMLYESSRPPYLIKRIASDKGHLDNVAASYYLSNLIGSNTKEVNLAHISEECNTEEIALNTFNEVIYTQKGERPSLLLRCASVNHVVSGGKDDQD